MVLSESEIVRQAQGQSGETGKCSEDKYIPQSVIHLDLKKQKTCWMTWNKKKTHSLPSDKLVLQ
jgi:hypothetical protein